MRDNDAILSELDYERLPPALRRKYFSSLERLRLAQDGGYPIHTPRISREPQRPLTSSNASSSSTRTSLRRPSTTFDNSLLTPSTTTRNKLRKSSCALTISPQLVAHYASLPPTLQRKHFSREEQVLLASRINHVIFDAADEVLYKQYELKSRPSTSHLDLYSDLPELLESDSEEMELSPEELSSLRWLDEDEEELDLSLYDYHVAVAETAQPSQSSNHRSSYRRGLLSSRRPFSRRSSSTVSTNDQSAWPLPSTIEPIQANKIYRTIGSAPSSSHRKNRASTSSLDPAATHYQDPAARMKLRVYLASPQKFDEALEFGFPSMQDSTTKRVVKHASNSRSMELNHDSIVEDDVPSLSDGDDQEISTIDSPRTPDVSAFASTFSKSKDSSLDRTSIKPKVMRDFMDPYVHALASNREMTLHMTLTRPDLRSPDESSSTRDINARPLEQVPLHFSDDTTSFWDSLPDNESKVKKLFKKLKLRQ